jgi:hypothetical protein
MAQYRAGRVTVTFDSDIVQGTDTEWMSNVKAGDIFLIRGDEVPYRVAAVTNNQTLRLSARYASPTETNSFYSITRDFTEHFDLPIIHNGDVDAVPLFAEALIQLDAKLQGAGTGGGGGSLATLSDVTTSGAIPGDQFVVLPNGSYGFVRPITFTIAFDHAAGDGGRIFKSYADGTVTARRIKAAGGTVTENADDITINIPPGGETNTLATAGSAQSQTLVAPKSGTVLRTKGLRAGSNVTLTPEGNDLVIASLGGGGGTGLSYTLAAVGNGTSLVASPSGAELRVRSLLHDSHFTVTDDVSGSVSIALAPLSVTDINTFLWNSIGVGQVLTRNSDSKITGLTLPAPGIGAVVQDTAPVLGGNLTVTNRRVIGLQGDTSGHIETPRVKTYTLILQTRTPIELTGFAHRTGAGTVDFRVDIGGVPPSNPDEGDPPAISGTAISSGVNLSVPAAAAAVDPGIEITLTVTALSASAEDFTFTLYYVTT